eukprot:c8356_g1_i2.p1 GENE.c8356_g1_i2~~c8356_g1_i2.p1  ORF type:complete len:351 (+),score=86.61 c8356_g1_i2:441-1493(+)
MVLVSGMLLMPLGMAFGIPVLTIAVKRYTDNDNRTFAFGLYYLVMNVAALIAGPVSDACQVIVGPSGIDLNGLHITRFRALLLISTFISGLQVIVACFLKDVTLSSEGNVTQFDPLKTVSFRSRLKSVGLLFKDVLFWKLLVLSLAILGVRMVFRHMDATLPKWMIREIGEDARYGMVIAINPAMVILLVPFVSATTKDWDSYDMILYGSIISATSVFWLCFDASYWNAVLFVAQLSIGEVFYSPKTYEYFMTLAPVGKEGLYTTFSNAPLFAAKFAVGGVSGMLLEDYCAENSTSRQCWKMWLVIGCITMTSPLMLCAIKGWVTRTNKRLVAVEMCDNPAWRKQEDSTD